jgi:hypothetical protein
MKPHVVMLKLTPMDDNYQELEAPIKFPAIEIENIVFLRMPKEQCVGMKLTGQLETLTQAAAQSGKTFVLLPEKAEVLRVEEKWEVLDQ